MYEGINLFSVGFPVGMFLSEIQEEVCKARIVAREYRKDYNGFTLSRTRFIKMSLLRGIDYRKFDYSAHIAIIARQSPCPE